MSIELFYKISSGKVESYLLDYVANEFESIIDCIKPATLELPPSPPLSQASSPSTTSSCLSMTKAPMPLRSYIEHVVNKSKIDTGTLLLSLSYARRLRHKLHDASKGMECTHHRIFLATVIIAYKYIHDAVIKNKYWVDYSLRLFSNIEINLMEKQLLQLLDYNLEIPPHDLTRIVHKTCQLYQAKQTVHYPTPPYEYITYFTDIPNICT